MTNLNTFRMQLLRQHPQVYGAATVLVAALAQQEAVTGVTAEMGVLTPRGFDGSLSTADGQRLLQLLQTCDGWQAQSNWYLVEEYQVDATRHIRIAYENNQRTEEVITVQQTADSVFTYQSPADTTVAVRFETPLDAGPVNRLQAYETATAVVERYFVMPCGSVPGVIWRFCVRQLWSAETMSAAEAAMVTQPPRWAVKCQALKVPPNMTDEHQYLVVTSLLLKMQDLLDIPVFADTVVDQPSALQLHAFQLV